MSKKKRSNKIENSNNLNNFLRLQKLTLGQKWADKVTKFVGSWLFIIVYLIFFSFWISVNTIWLINQETFDPYPFVFLNLVLACITGIQAPIILMSQNRTEDRDRIELERDYVLNKKSEYKIENIQKELKSIKMLIKNKRRLK